MKKLIVNMLSIAVLSSTAYGVQNAAQNFKMADVNGDNIVTSEEFYNNQAKNMEQKANQGKALRNAQNAPKFEDVDTNGDGKLELNEYNTFHNQRREQMMEQRANQRNWKGQGQGMGRGQGMGQGQGRGYGNR